MTFPKIDRNPIWRWKRAVRASPKLAAVLIDNWNAPLAAWDCSSEGLEASQAHLDEFIIITKAVSANIRAPLITGEPGVGRSRLLCNLCILRDVS